MFANTHPKATSLANLRECYAFCLEWADIDLNAFLVKMSRRKENVFSANSSSFLFISCKNISCAILYLVICSRIASGMKLRRCCLLDVLKLLRENIVLEGTDQI